MFGGYLREAQGALAETVVFLVVWGLFCVVEIDMEDFLRERRE